MFQVPNVKNVHMYPKAVPMNWGEKKLTQICLTEMGIDRKAGGVFLFFNRKMDQMKLFFLDDMGSQVLSDTLCWQGNLVILHANPDRFLGIA
jgi:hypothetical protein